MARSVRIVVLGSGFGGIYTTLYLEEALRGERGVEILLVSRENYFLFSPLLHEVAAGTVETRHIIQPVRTIRRDREFDYRQAVVTGVLPDRREVVLEGGDRIGYDYLVLALGSVNNFFGVEAIRTHAYRIKSLNDSIRLRNHVLEQFELAEAEREEEVRRRRLTFVVAGGGPIGVEYATELHDVIEEYLLKRYRGLRAEEVNVCLVEARDRLLAGLDPALSEEARAVVGNSRIDLRLSTMITGAGPGWVELDEEIRLSTETLVWATGVKANPVAAEFPAEHDRQGRLIVEPTLAVPGYPGVYAIGDNARFDHTRDGPLPQLGQVAIRQAVRVAGNIANEIQSRAPEPMEYTYLGAIVALGHGRATVSILGLRFHGRLGWFFLRANYLMKLIGLPKKIKVALDWCLSTFFDIDLSRLHFGEEASA